MKGATTDPSAKIINPPKIIETIIIGKLTKINPFNQPAVEQVKNITKNLLS